MLTFNDLCELLKKEDEVTLIELLDISSDELVDVLESFIEDRQDYLRNYYNEDDSSVD